MYMRIIAAIELALEYQKGVILLNNKQSLFVAETMVTAALASNSHILWSACEPCGAGTARSLCAAVADGHRKVAYVVDTSVLERDTQYVSLISAIVAGDAAAIRQRLSAADARALLARYQENYDCAPDATENELIELMINQVVKSIKPILLIDMQSSITDELLSAAPPLRRNL